MGKLLWVTPALASGPLSGAASQDMASLRYRLLSPARVLAQAGLASEVLNPGDAAAAALRALDDYQAVVIGKLAHDDPAVVGELGGVVLALVRRAGALGVRSVADVCDDRFEHPVLGAYWRELVLRVDQVVAGSDALAGIVRARTAVPVVTIGDPVEGRRAEARFAPPRARSWLGRITGATPRLLKLLWYGHQSNLDEITAALPALAAWTATQDRVDGVELEMVTAAGFGAEALVARARAAQGAHGVLRLRFTPWSMAAQSQALRDCDCVIIPATVDNAQKRAKTANRLTEALWAGRPVLAHAVPSYLEFADCAWIGEDLVAGLGVALRNPQQVLRQVRAGQGIVARRYSPEAIGGLWAQALRSA